MSSAPAAASSHEEQKNGKHANERIRSLSSLLRFFCKKESAPVGSGQGQGGALKTVTAREDRCAATSQMVRDCGATAEGGSKTQSEGCLVLHASIRIWSESHHSACIPHMHQKPVCTCQRTCPASLMTTVPSVGLDGKASHERPMLVRAASPCAVFGIPVQGSESSCERGSRG